MNSNLTTNTLTMKLEELGRSFMAASLGSYHAEQSRNENSFLERLIELVDLEYVPHRERASRTHSEISGMPQYKALDDFNVSWLKGG